MTSRPAPRKPSKPRSPSSAVPALHAPATLAPGEARTLSILALVLGGAYVAVASFMAFGPHAVGDYFTETDFYGAYADGARMLQRFHVDPSRYGVIGPVYEVVLALVGFVIRDLFVAAELISVAAMAGTLWCWHRTIARLADPRIALGALAVFVTNTHFLRYGYAVTTDALALLLQAIVLMRLLAPRAPGAAPPVAATLLTGALAGVAFLTRYSAVSLLAFGVIVLAWRPATRRAALVFALGFALPVAPWLLYCLASGAKFSFQLHHNIAYEVFARAKGITWDDYQRTLQPQFHSLADVIAHDPGAVFGRMLYNAWDHLRLDAVKLVGVPVTIAAALGVLLAIRERRLGALAPFALAMALGFLVLVPAFHSERYSLAVLPLWALAAGVAFGGASFAVPAPATGGRVWLKAAVAFVPLVLAGRASFAFERYIVTQLPTETRAAGEALRKLARPGDRLIARKPHVSYYAGVRALPFPFADSLDALAAAAKKDSVRWLWFSWPEAEMRPGLFYLLDSTAVVPGLTQRFLANPKPGILYEIGPELGTPPSWIKNDTLRTYHILRGRLMVNDEDGAAWYGFAVVARAMQNLGAAQRAARLATRFHADKLEAFMLLGTISLDLGDVHAAREAFQAALPLERGGRRARLGLGWSYLLADDAAGAAREWRSIVGLTNDPGSLARMEELFRSVGDVEAAAEARSRRLQLGAGR